MTGNCTNSIMPDSITGMVFASEGIARTVTLLNGPMGCKFYHSTTSQFLMTRPPLYLPGSPDGKKVPVGYQFYDSWFFRQSQVPCTWLDGEDYIYGSADQMRQGLQYLKENVDFALLVIVNSPGASLIGDALKEMACGILPDRKVVMLESPGYSESFGDGYRMAVSEIFRQAFLEEWKAGRKEKGENQDSPSVNIFGMSIWQRYCDGDREELERLLGMMGIRVNSVPFAGCTPEDIRRIPAADLNVVLYPERGAEAAGLLYGELGMPYYCCSRLPIGFPAVEEFCREICAAAAGSRSAAGRTADVTAETVLEETRRARALAWSKIHPIYETSGMPEGVLFAVEGSGTEVLSYASYLQSYLGMLPDALAVTEGSLPAEMAEQWKEALSRPVENTDAELVFGNANTIALLKTKKEAFCGIEISNPGMGYTDFLPKTHLGLRGTLFLTEQVMNGLMARL